METQRLADIIEIEGALETKRYKRRQRKLQDQLEKAKRLERNKVVVAQYRLDKKKKEKDEWDS